MRRLTRTTASLITLFLAAAAPAVGQIVQERVDLAVFERIRDEGLNRSQIEELAGYLTDVIGPRLTNSPAMRRANEWTAQKFREWGLSNVVIEPWGEFGRGWERVSYSGRILTPFVQPLNAQPLAWTGSTRGTVKGPAVIVEAETVEDLEKYRGKLRNAFVLMQPPTGLGAEFERAPLRTPLEELVPDPFGRRSREQARQAAQPTPEEMQRRMQEMRQAAERRAALNNAARELFQAERVAAILQPSARNYGIIRAGGGAGRDPNSPIPLPELVVAQEQYGQIYRNVKRGIPVELEVNVQNRFFSDDLRAYNTLADLPGTDKADEYVMIGAHLDSWHTGTGATDNAAGSVVMMEAMRILKALDLKPRRTIRIALWSGEEQGLLGSRRWVENHPELAPKISAYLNVDNGTGRIRGIWNQSNEAATPIFEQILWPFRDLGVIGVRHGNTGGTDHLSFDRVGIPGFNFIQDPIEYGTRTHHTNVDVFEHLVLDDLKQAAVIVAATAYHLAMRDEMMPRKPAAATSN
ncbi:MAG TPA: M20/M25/M40 family metallo-hydrolase [Longimicrobiales bacterium]|nr:M20/M25/M40 family metallo-hydrolase [Longimicrobiales bacterium]